MCCERERSQHGHSQGLPSCDPFTFTQGPRTTVNPPDSEGRMDHEPQSSAPSGTNFLAPASEPPPTDLPYFAAAGAVWLFMYVLLDAYIDPDQPTSMPTSHPPIPSHLSNKPCPASVELAGRRWPIAHTILKLSGCIVIVAAIIPIETRDTVLTDCRAFLAWVRRWLRRGKRHE